MDENINVAEILKDKPEGTKLWTDMFGSVTLYVVTDVCDAFQVKHHNKEPWFDKDGKLCKEGVLCIYPSKSMRDWRKFAWKRGDALSCGVDNLCIFEKWANKEYTEFYAKFVTPNYSGNTFKTEKWSKETNEAVIKQYISNIEEFKGGKLNLTTLEIEKTQPEFKVGDIAFADYGNRKDVFIVSDKTNLSEGYNSFISLDLSGLTLNMGYRTSYFKSNICKLRIATEEEKQQLFDALEKEGKAWDAVKKEVVNLKPNFDELKPFDKVVVRCSEADRWSIDFFSYKVHNGYICTGDAWFGYCLPYNDETAHLLGTTDEWKGGEG